MVRKALLAVVALALVVVLPAGGCSRQSMQPEPQDPAAEKTPEPRTISLSELKYGDLSLRGLFADFSGVSDFAMVSGGLLYVYDKTMWSTRFDGAHTAVETHLPGTYDIWSTAVKEEHFRLQRQSDALPDYLLGVPLSQGRYNEREYLLAFSGPVDHRALFLTEPGGEMRAVLRDANDLTLLGWTGRATLVFFADFPGLGPNIYLLDTWHDFVVPMRAAFHDTLDLSRPVISDSFVGETGRIWRYDGTNLAYGVGNRVYAVDGSAVHRQIYLGNAPVVWAQGDLMITADFTESVLPELRYGSRQKTLNPLRLPMTIEFDRMNMRLYYVFVDGLDTGLAYVDLRDMTQTELFYTAEGHYLSALALSPDRSELIFVQAATLDVAEGPYDEYRNEVFRYDLISGNMQQLKGFGLDDDVSFSLIASAHWADDGKILLGWQFSGSPMGEKWLNSYTFAESGEVTSMDNWQLHLQVEEAEGGTMFLSNYSSSEGYWDFMDMDLWYFEVSSGTQPVRLTERKEWQVDKNTAVAYNPKEGWLFVIREKGWKQPDWREPIFHGVILDLSGNEYTFLTEGLTGQESAVWVGKNLYIQKKDRIVRVAFR